MGTVGLSSTMARKTVHRNNENEYKIQFVNNNAIIVNNILTFDEDLHGGITGRSVSLVIRNDCRYVLNR